MIETVKVSMKKYQKSGHNLDLAMLVYRAMPLMPGLPSPVEWLNGSKYRALLPTFILQTMFTHHTAHQEIMVNQFKQSDHYNKSVAALQPLNTNQPACMQKNLKIQCEKQARVMETNTDSHQCSSLKMFQDVFQMNMDQIVEQCPNILYIHDDLCVYGY